MTLPKYVEMIEVGPRDGLQNEKTILSSETKIEFINRLSETGLKYIEVTSFVSPKWIPQLSDASIVYESIQKKNGIVYSALIPNIEGLDRALNAGVQAIAVFSTPSEAFSKHNTNCSVEESLNRIHKVVEKAKKHKLPVRAYVSCVLGCPYEGEIDPKKTAYLSKKLYEMGCDTISLGDTIGTGTPLKTQLLLEEVAKLVLKKALAVHFHDTYGQALANLYVALQFEINKVDASVTGLGGCPYAKGASGNVATEDVLFMLNGMGIQTGVDLQKIIEVGQFVSKRLDREVQSKVSRAFRSDSS